MRVFIGLVLLFLTHGDIICFGLNSDKELCSVKLLAFRNLYLDTVVKSITGYNIRTPGLKPGVGSVLRRTTFDPSKRKVGRDWPEFGYAMSGLARLNNVRRVLEDIFTNNVPGDFMECGVWRGGTSIFARSVIVAYGESRSVILADSFHGLPRSSTSKDSDKWSKMDYLRVSQSQVQSHFRDFDLFDSDHVQFVVGFFSTSLKKFRIENIGRRQLSVIRADGDMYESCLHIIVYLYDLLSVGGYFIVDDWTGFPCQEAITEFRKHVGINDKIILIDASSVYWQKTSPVHYSVEILLSKLLSPYKLQG